MLDRVEELTRIVERDVPRRLKLHKPNLIPFEIMFVYRDRFGLDDQSSSWYNVRDIDGISGLAAQFVYAYGYHVRTVDKKVFDFWFDGKNYNLYSYGDGKTNRYVNPPKIFKSIIRP